MYISLTTYNKLMKMSCLLDFILKYAWQELRGSISSPNFFSLTSCSPINSHPPCLASFISFNDVISLTNGVLPTQCELLLLSWSNDQQGWFVVCIELHQKKKVPSVKTFFYGILYLWVEFHLSSPTSKQIHTHCFLPINLLENTKSKH